MVLYSYAVFILPAELKSITDCRVCTNESVSWLPHRFSKEPKSKLKSKNLKSKTLPNYLWLYITQSLLLVSGDQETRDISVSRTVRWFSSRGRMYAALAVDNTRSGTPHLSSSHWTQHANTDKRTLLYENCPRRVNAVHIAKLVFIISTGSG